MKVHIKKLSTLILVFILVSGNLPAKANEIFLHIKQEAEQVKKKPYIVFLITKDSLNYEAYSTIPRFAEMLEKEYGYKCKVILGDGDHGSYHFPDLKPLRRADLLVVFVRRIALPHTQMNEIKKYLDKGKPLIGIRTANHAFKVNGKVEDGFEEWPTFVSDVLGCENRGYGSAESGTDVKLAPAVESHPIVKNIQSKQWHSTGQVYRVTPLLDKEATVLLEGLEAKTEGKTEPIAWTRTAGKSKVFYTSLGHPDDFKTTQFITLLTNGIKWTLFEE